MLNRLMLVENYAKVPQGSGRKIYSLKEYEYERVLTFDLSAVTVVIWRGPLTHIVVYLRQDLTERGIAVRIWIKLRQTEEKQGRMPDGAVIIAAITSCTNTSPIPAMWWPPV